MIPKVALFKYGSQGYALPVESMEHILPAPQIYPLPQLNTMYAGVFLHAEHVVPLLRLERLFVPGGDVADASLAFVVLFLTEFGVLGIPATHVMSVVDRAAGQVESQSGKMKNKVPRAFVLEGQKFPLLDATALLAFLLGGGENYEEG